MNRLYLFELLRMLEFLENKFRKPFYVEELARFVGYSSWHFRRIFKQYTGESLAQRLHRLRLEEGKRERKSLPFRL